MKTLYLLRHAHAGSRQTAYADFDRPLDDRGREEAEAVAAYLQEKGISFDFVMCSAALRTQETLEALRPAVGTKDIEISEKFYNIPEDEIRHHISQLPDTIEKALYIGHNPGIAFAILRLAKAFPDFLNQGVDPATLVGFQVSIDKWEELAWGLGTITDLFQPTLAPAKSVAPEGS